MTVLGTTVQDSYQAEANMEKINFWSVIHMMLLFLVGFTQVTGHIIFFILSVSDQAK